jgi:hypothetical protein
MCAADGKGAARMTSPFHRQREVRESIFAADPNFRPCGKQQKSHSQLQTEYVARQTRKTGKNPGTLIDTKAKGKG